MMISQNTTRIACGVATVVQQIAAGFFSKSRSFAEPEKRRRRLSDVRVKEFSQTSSNGRCHQQQERCECVSALPPGTICCDVSLFPTTYYGLLICLCMPGSRSLARFLLIKNSKDCYSSFRILKEDDSRHGSSSRLPHPILPYTLASCFHNSFEQRQGATAKGHET